ncbi:D-TA family PLP-dependent enzyme [Mangrovibrevibacter kandeliae]|uniref:D-TA family PLP-dependent enzyme n=1 Tax=Mangrovibrevibacter kandeliae TaxID=2968473 RepID=UPI002117F643|nr:D-TA family PLP-dependent enzyme [Aurantimonas sp. CSK15Z-1]MCQ8783734.1 D-TA family PLP-dependent enzyme [Aurantimonas sp. CSK15Z-1]
MRPIPDDLDTPCLLIDLEKVERNLRRAQDHADANAIVLRPHIKTHKLVRFARRQVELGAVGITCQKIGEAEVMADGGIADILLPYNIVGAAKLERLRRLAQRVRLKVTADGPFVVAGYSKAFRGEAEPLTVLVECDTGGGRCGVQTPFDALELATLIAEAPGLRFGGLMTYPAKHRVAEAAAWLVQARKLLEDAQLPPETVTTGGTPDLWAAGPATGATEYRPGTYVFLDRFQVAEGVGAPEDCALHVVATVVSRPTATRAIIDAGSKALTSDLLGLTGYGSVAGYPGAVITGLSEEHGTLDVSACDTRPEVGECVRILPNHVCPVVNLFDAVTLLHADGRAETVPVDARGRLR